MLRKTYISFMLVVLYLPLIVMSLASFNSSKYSMLWQSFSLKWFSKLFHDTGLWQVTLNSLKLSFIVALSTTLITLYLSFNEILFHNKNKTLTKLFYSVVLLPDIIIAVSLLVFFNLIRLKLGFFSLYLAHIFLCLPFAYFIIKTKLNKFNLKLISAAYDLGASKKIIMIKILLPSLLSALLSAFLLSFTLSFDDVIISYFVSGPEYQVLPLYIYGQIRNGVSPELNALCTLIFSISICVVFLSHKLYTRKS